MVLEEGQSHDLVLISKISLGISVSKPLEPCLAFRDLRQPVLRVCFFFLIFININITSTVDNKTPVSIAHIRTLML